MTKPIAAVGAVALCAVAWSGYNLWRAGQQLGGTFATIVTSPAPAPLVELPAADSPRELAATTGEAFAAEPDFVEPATDFEDSEIEQDPNVLLQSFLTDPDPEVRSEAAALLEALAAEGAPRESESESSNAPLD